LIVHIGHPYGGVLFYMANSSVTVTDTAGNIPVDVMAMGDGDNRQIVVLGDPTTLSAVAPVSATTGLYVDVRATALPTGAATAANQTSIIGYVDGIEGLLTTIDADTGNLVTIETETSNISTKINTVATDTTAIKTSVQLIDDTIFAEDVAASAGDKGIPILAVRRDANTSLVSSDNDYANLQVTDTGSLKVAITAGAGSGGTSIADAASFTIASTSITPIGGIYEASPTALADGKVGILEVDSSRNLLVHEQYAPAAEDNTNQVIAQQIRPVAGSTYSPLTFGIFGTDVDLAAKGSAGNLFSIYATNINATVRYLQIHNKATAPANPNVPILSLPIPAGTSTAPSSIKLGREFFGEGGLYLSTGVAIGISTTEATFTAATITDHDYFGQYI
jgi:hypothetical protein